jgi:hypothetical protein
MALVARPLPGEHLADPDPRTRLALPPGGVRGSIAPPHLRREDIVRNVLQRSRRWFPWSALAAVLVALPALAQNASPRDGQHDFDFEIGTWNTHLRRLQNPLSGSTTWVEYTGTTVVRKVWDGRANLVELAVAGPAGRIEALSLRLYDPQARQWSLNFANARGGGMGVPTVGEFRSGRGEFYDQEDFNGRKVLVRFVIIPLTPDSCRFEQSFSDDGGKTWELNWIAVDTRTSGGAAEPR